MEFELKRLEPVMISINGKEYPARMPNRAIKELCEMWGVKYFELFDRLAGDALELHEMLDVLYVTLKAGGVKLTRALFNDMEHDINFVSHITAKITELFDRTQSVENILEDTKEDTKKKL